MHIFSVMFTGQAFLHSCLHFLGLHLSGLMIAILSLSKFFPISTILDNETLLTINNKKFLIDSTKLNDENKICFDETCGSSIKKRKDYTTEKYKVKEFSSSDISRSIFNVVILAFEESDMIVCIIFIN
jgi:hypothetical protein